jgi:hypothetical protein
MEYEIGSDTRATSGQGPVSLQRRAGGNIRLRTLHGHDREISRPSGHSGIQRRITIGSANVIGEASSAPIGLLFVADDIAARPAA